ncbi:response regulator [Polaribacter batillariae]|uniref:Response regulator n=1 Tax=Polaribacter batillariae TaxID=2808900 RepID=A0ABX7SS20_9FLAO|nr:response regulator [Polaribacter batillariae]QTD36941.1 response regulator [Polaribacter batillariae]
MESKLNNLLVVEDNPYIGEEIVNAVKKVNGIKNIHLTKTLQEAISSLNKTSFELVTLDLSLPDGNGIELLKWFIEKKIKKDVFVFSTSKELKGICLKYGALAFFDKSTGFDELIESIKKLNQ